MDINENLTEEKIEKVFESCEPGISAKGYYLTVLNAGNVYEYPDKRINNSILCTYLKKRFGGIERKGLLLS